MSNPSYTYTLTNGTTADATQVMQNFTDILNGVTDGTKDLSISALTCAGTATLNGDVNFGNSSGDTLTFTGSVGSSIPVKTTASYDFGSATLGLRSVYLGNASTFTVRLLASSSQSATYTLTLPTAAPAAANSIMLFDTGGVATFSTLVSGTYSPTAATSTNTTAASVNTASYIKVGSIVHVIAHGSVTITSNNTLSRFTLTVPVSTINTIAHGVMAWSGGGNAYGAGWVEDIDSTTVAVRFNAGPSNAGSGDWGVSFSYVAA